MNRTLTTLVLAAVAAGGLSVAAPAHAQVGGRRCALTTKGGITELSGGPLVADTIGATITLTCTLQIGAANSTHADADAAVVTSGPSLQVAVVPPTPVSAVVGNEHTFVCTEATVNGTTYYLDAVAGTWGTDDTVACGQPYDTRRALPILDEQLADLNSVLLLTDPLVCAVFLQLAPGVPGVIDIAPDGDVTVAGQAFYDCPPYAS